jgi:hypothetical protein
VLCLTSCCSVLLQDLYRVFPIGSSLDGLYSSLSLVVDLVRSCALALLVFQFHHLRWFSCRASRPSVLVFVLRCSISVPARFTVHLLPSIFGVTTRRSPPSVHRPQDPFLIFFYRFSPSILPLQDHSHWTRMWIRLSRPVFSAPKAPRFSALVRKQNHQG